MVSLVMFDTCGWEAMPGGSVRADLNRRRVLKCKCNEHFNGCDDKDREVDSEKNCDAMIYLSFAHAP